MRRNSEPVSVSIEECSIRFQKKQLQIKRKKLLTKKRNRCIIKARKKIQANRENLLWIL